MIKLALTVSALAFSLLTLPLCAQKDNASGYDKSDKATVLHETLVYLAADEGSGHVATVLPGHELVIVQRSGPWLKVFANTDSKDKQNDSEDPEFGEDQEVTPGSGWIHDKGIVTPGMTGGDRLLFGAAALYEDAAEQPNAPKDAVSEAHLLFRRAAEYFPQSPLAAEAAWRSADIRWQADRHDQSSLPSSHEQSSYLRQPIYEGEMKKVIKLFPGSEWAQRAAYAMLDNKLCGDWQGLPKCPEQETAIYRKYAEQFPNGVKSAEALYNAVYRQGVLVTMYTVEEDRKKVAAAKANTAALAQQMQQVYPQSQWTMRAQAVAYRVAQGIAVYGTDRD